MKISLGTPPTWIMMKTNNKITHVPGGFGHMGPQKKWAPKLNIQSGVNAAMQRSVIRAVTVYANIKFRYTDIEDHA